MSKSVIIKGGSLTKLEEIKNTREIINKLVNIIDKRGTEYCGDLITESETVAICNALSSISDTIGGIITTDSNVTVSNCAFYGLDTGLKIEQSPKLETISIAKTEEKYEDNYEECSNNGDDGYLEYESELGY